MPRTGGSRRMIPAELAEDLEKHVETIGTDQPVFRLPVGAGSRMLKVDLRRARVPYRNESGECFDFHSLRGQFATLPDRSGATPSEIQRLMRHSDPRLTARYIRPHADLDGAATSFTSLRPTYGSENQCATLAATGTDGPLPCASDVSGHTCALSAGSTDSALRPPVSTQARTGAGFVRIATDLDGSTPEWIRTTNLRFRRPQPSRRRA
jgi:hypothetical protein